MPLFATANRVGVAPPASRPDVPPPPDLEHPDKGLVAYLEGDRIIVQPLRANQRFPTPPPLALRVPNDAEIAQTLANARDARARDVQNLLFGGQVSRGSQVTLKDGSARIDYMFTRLLGTDVQLINDMGRVAASEGFRVVVETDGLDNYGIDAEVRRFIDEVPLPHAFRTGDGPRSEIIDRTVPAICSSWSEDEGEISAHSVSVPATPLRGATNIRSIVEDRERRDMQHIDMHCSGEVAREFRQYFRIRLALTMNPPLRVRDNISHIEGGNMLPLKAPDGTTQLLIGKDSLAATIEILAQQTGIDFASPQAQFDAMEGIARAAIAADYDLRTPDHVVPVEQAAYHLDTHAFVNGNCLVVNDPKMAAEIELGWPAFQASQPQHSQARSMMADLQFRLAMDEWEEDREALYQRSLGVYERVERREKKIAPLVDDARAANIPVVPFAGKFFKDDEKYNAMSHESGTNPAGERYVILANTFVDSIRDHVLDFYLKRAPRPYKRVYLLDAAASLEGAIEGGGISCRYKARSAPDSYLPTFASLVAG